MAASQQAPYIIEPFDPERHDRAAFSCGVEQVDNYFQKAANKLPKDNGFCTRYVGPLPVSVVRTLIAEK